MATLWLPLRSRRRARRWDQVDRVALALESLCALCGIGGGAYLFVCSGDAMARRYLDGTFFASWRWPGVALFVLVGLGAACAASAETRRLRVAPWAHIAYGAGLVAWVSLEAAWVVAAPPLQITFGLVGAVLAARGAAHLIEHR